MLLVRAVGEVQPHDVHPGLPCKQCGIVVARLPSPRGLVHAVSAATGSRSCGALRSSVRPSTDCVLSPIVQMIEVLRKTCLAKDSGLQASHRPAQAPVHSRPRRRLPPERLPMVGCTLPAWPHAPAPRRHPGTPAHTGNEVGRVLLLMCLTRWTLHGSRADAPPAARTRPASCASVAPRAAYICLAGLQPRRTKAMSLAGGSIF